MNFFDNDIIFEAITALRFHEMSAATSNLINLSVDLIEF